MQVIVLFLLAQGIDFWGTNQSKAKGEDLWTEPVMGEDGSVRLHTPPEKVVRFLKEPTEENAAAYLSWQKERLDRVRTAQEMLQKVQLKGLAREIGDKLKSKELSAALTYYSKPDCPFCRVQDPILEKLSALVPSLSINRSSEFLTESIEAVPAMILTVRLGEKSKRVRFDGVTGEIKILTSLGTLMQEIVK